jgi:acyl homoserine lactone synthase
MVRRYRTVSNLGVATGLEIQMINLIRPEHSRKFTTHITGMYRLRYRVFKQRLDWAVDVEDGTEIDAYDAADPVYLLRVDTDDNVTACVRLLPTTGPYMLRDTFHALLAGQIAPNSPVIWESSRFATEQSGSLTASPAGLSPATYELLAGMIEFGLASGLSQIVTVTDIRVERILRRADCPLQRLGEPVKIETTTAVAGSLEVSKDALRRVRQASGIDYPVLWEPVWTGANDDI